MFHFLNQLSWSVLIVACLTLGLAPFVPKPHLIEKLQMLFHGELKRPIDWFDMFMHGVPWVLLILKAALSLKKAS
ncbi:MAG: RND transporter [Bdellovibrio sp.]|nr:MAG: RND transporter [Bdellovibrio sp.]